MFDSVSSVAELQEQGQWFSMERLTMPNQSAAAKCLSAVRSSVAGVRERGVRSTRATEAVAELGRQASNMKNAKRFGTLFMLLVFFVMQAHARLVRDIDMKTLMKDSQLVFVGQLKSVKPSGITTKLTYPSWKGVVFEWLRVEVEVIEPVKGTKKGELVSTLMLSTRGPGPTFDPPGMVEPKVGQYHLLCLLPANSTGAYAAVTAPFDDRLAIFLLDRKHWTERAHYYKEGKEVAFHEQNEKNRALWDLVNDRGEIIPDGAEHLRKQYAAEIAIAPPKDAVIHLKWNKQTSAGGWEWSIPDDGSEADGKKKWKTPGGPITHP